MAQVSKGQGHPWLGLSFDETFFLVEDPIEQLQICSVETAEDAEELKETYNTIIQEAEKLK